MDSKLYYITKLVQFTILKNNILFYRFMYYVYVYKISKVQSYHKTLLLIYISKKTFLDKFFIPNFNNYLYIFKYQFKI